MMFNPFKKKRNAGQVKALFLHIQKTAGTSIIHLARQHYGSNLTSHGDCWNGKSQDFQDVGFVSGHIGYQFAKPLMQDRFSFTFLRDPIERVLSFYYFCRSRDPSEYKIFELAHTHSLTDFLAVCLEDPFHKMQVWNNQVWQLAYGYSQFEPMSIDSFSGTELLQLAKDHLAEFSHVGCTETFPSDLAVICRELGFPKLASNESIPVENVTPRRSRFDEQSEEAKVMLTNFTALDRNLYDHARITLAASRQVKRKVW